jgi:hypothetical protein
MVRFNIGSFMIAFYLLCLAYLTILEEMDWDFTALPLGQELITSLLFAGPPALIAVASLVVPIVLNPYILGWPIYPPFGGCCGGRKGKGQVEEWKVEKAGKKRTSSSAVVDLHTFMSSANVDAEEKLGKEIGRVQNKPDVELGSLATYEFGGRYPMSVATSPSQGKRKGKRPSNVPLKSSSQPGVAHTAKAAI